MTVDVRVWRDVLCEAITTHMDEISCEECDAQLDRFVELALQGKDSALRMPRVHDHLEHCRECREEYQGLVLAIRGTAQGTPPHRGGGVR
jgi:hypothetical protein